MFENVGLMLEQLSEDKDISIDLLKDVVSHTMLQALKKKYGGETNFHIEYDEKNNPSVYKGVQVVENVTNTNNEILLSEAKSIDENITLGEEVWLILDTVEEFARIESTLAKAEFIRKLAELEKNIIYEEFKRRENQLVNGYFQRKYNDTIYVNLGRGEGILSKRDQSPRESYAQGDKIRAYIYAVKNEHSGNPSIFLTRTKNDFIKKLFELEIPEIADGIVEIKAIERQPGFKTKVAVSSNKAEVDPQGACVGPKGARIQSIIKEIEGEKIDIIKWSKDIREFIAKSVAPAKPSRVIITNLDNRTAMVIVPDEQLSLALGKAGYNIKIASHLTGYHLDVKTETDIKENPDLIKDYGQIFFDEQENESTDIVASSEETQEETPLQSNLYSLDGLEQEIIETLINAGIDSIETLFEMDKNVVAEKTSLDKDKVSKIFEILNETVEIVEDDENYDSMQEDVVEEVTEIQYECPNCGATIVEGMNKCESCGIEISFE